MTVNRGTGVELAVDTSVISLTARERKPFGRHAGWLRLICTNGEELLLPTVITVPHPFQPVVDRLFLGLVKPAQTVTRRIPLRASDNAVSSVLAGDGQLVQEALLEDGAIVVTVTTPEKRGYFTGQLTCSFSNNSLPPVVIPVSGIVTH